MLHNNKSMLDKNKKILVTGAYGMVGTATVKALKEAGFTNIKETGRQELDLTDYGSVDQFFEKERPAYVFMIAAKVGGINANMLDQVGFMLENLKIEMNLFEACHKYKTEKNLFLGSSCIYPKESPQPIKEEYLLTGPLEPTNEGYALAKISGLKMAQYFHKQKQMLTVCPMPCNIYGTNDDYDLEKCHVLSALIKRFCDAKQQNLKQVTLWGTGIPLREFIHVSDVARGLIHLMDHFESSELINLGTGLDISIKDLAHLIAQEVGFEGEIVWDSSMPNGMLKKCMDINKLKALGFEAEIDLQSGIQQSIQEYRCLSSFH